MPIRQAKEHDYSIDAAGSCYGAWDLHGRPADPARGLPLAAEFHTSYNASGYYDATLGPEVCWVENAAGFSPPQLVRSARPWWVFPERARHTILKHNAVHVGSAPFDQTEPHPINR